MKCQCCEKENAKLRMTRFYPYTNTYNILCDECFSNHRIPYKEMLTYVSLYGEDLDCIPETSVKLILQELKKISIQENIGFYIVLNDFIKDLIHFNY